MGLTLNLVFAIVTGSFGSAFQHGYNTGVVNAPQALLENFINETYNGRHGSYPSNARVQLLISVNVAIYCLGGMVGALLSATVADKLGRKGGLLWNNIFVFISAGLQGLSKMAKSYEMLIIGRFIIGINNGINAALAPMYLTEISPVNLRGAVGSVYQLIITITILISQIFGLPVILGTKENWPILFGLIIIPTIFMLITFSFCPESPKYFLNKEDEENAEKALKWLLNTEEIQSDLDDMRNEIEEQKSFPKVTLKQMWTREMLRKPMIISIMIMLSQQFSGINVAIFFSTEIFKNSGLTDKGAVYATIGMGVMNVVMTVVSLVLVEIAGRKSLHLIGMSGMAVLSLILTISMGLKNVVSGTEYISVVCVIGFVIMFATGPGSIPWFFVSELFTQSARPLATSIAVCVNWLANFIVSVAFLPLEALMHYYVFLIFTVLLVLFCLFTYLEVPETKGRKIEDITEEFQTKK